MTLINTKIEKQNVVIVNPTTSYLYKSCVIIIMRIIEKWRTHYVFTYLATNLHTN